MRGKGKVPQKITNRGNMRRSNVRKERTWLEMRIGVSLVSENKGGTTR